MTSRFFLFIQVFITQMLFPLCLPNSITDGSYKKDYPPWNETNTPTAGAPRWVLPILVPLTRHGCGPSRYMSMRIAVSHLNRRDASICPAIAELRNLFEIEYEVADSSSNQIGALEGVIELQERLKTRGITMAVLEGPNGSGSSKATSSYLAIFGVPQISWAATHGQLSNKASYPNFFRVVSPDAHTMAVLAKFIKYLGYGTANAICFDADFQAGQLSDFRNAATEVSLAVLPFTLPSSGQGGRELSSENLLITKTTLGEIQKGKCRVVVGLAMGGEANDLWKTAYDLNLIVDEGWIWFGGDGISGNNIQGDIRRTQWFSGTLYVMVNSYTPAFEEYKARWASDMSTTDIPEFFSQRICRGGSVCANHSEFKGWKIGEHDSQLQCAGYTGLAYDATVVLAVILDRMITADKASDGKRGPHDFNAADWTAELKELQKPEKAIKCLTGEIMINENHDRMMGITIRNWQMDLLTAPQVASWSGVSGFTWVEGQKIVWPSGDSGTITNAITMPPHLPSGRSPMCPRGSVYNFSQDQCADCAAGKYYIAEACVDCAAGRFKNSTGLSECTDCAAGKFSSTRGQVQCTDCLPGTATSTAGLSACSDCIEGRFSSGTGSSECFHCKIGYVASTEGATACEICPIDGSETAFRGATSTADCKCPTGFFLHERTRKCIPHLTLGILLPFEAKPQYLPALSLFELDVQANIHRSGHSGLAAPLVPIPNISDLLRLQVYARNTGGVSSLAMRGMIELSGGQNSYTNVHGVVGGYSSSVSIPMASLGKMLETMQISHSSTASDLSNKEMYPFFLRTVPSDYYQGKAFWTYFVHFGFSTFALLYESDAYGEAFYEVAQDEILMGVAGQFSGHRLPAMNGVADYADVLKVVRGAEQIGGRLMALVVHSASIATMTKALKDNGVWAPEYQFLWSDAGSVSTGWCPVGSHSFFMEFESAQQSLFRHAFSGLKVEHYAGTAAKSRWHVDSWDPVAGIFNSSLIREAWIQQEDYLDPYLIFFFDACYSYVHAYNKLLRRGVDPRNISSRSMLDVLKNIEFHGVTGRVAFDRHGDRAMNYSLLNLQSFAEKDMWVPIGSYDSIANAIDILNASLWMDQSRSFEAPERLRGCQEGFVKDASSGCSRIPDPTDCSPGQGVVDANGFFIESRNITLAVQCKSCVAGTISQIINDTDQYAYVCSKCVSGRFQNQIGSTKSCEACEAGEEVNVDQSGCQVCSVGKSTTYGSCTVCSEGKYAPLRSGKCLVCESGKGVNIDQSGCESCPGGTSSTTGTCEPCPGGKYAAIGSGQCSECEMGHTVTLDQNACEAWWHVPIIIAASLPVAIILIRYLKRWCVATFRDTVQRRRYRNCRHKTVQRAADGTIESVGGHHLKLGLTLTKTSALLTDFPDVKQFRQQEVYEKHLGWLRNQEFFDLEHPSPNSYELCEMAKIYVDQKSMHDYSIAEICYVENDKGAGFVTVFVSHYQAEWIEVTLACMLTFERRNPGSLFFFDVFSIRQNVHGDFNVDLVQELITCIGNTLMVAHPWKNPNALKRIWCVFEVLCTIEGKANLNVAIVHSEELEDMQLDTARHELIYENVLDAIKDVRVERAEARNERDRTNIMDTIAAGPGFLKTNLAVAAALTSAIERELTRTGTSEGNAMVRVSSARHLARKAHTENCHEKLSLTGTSSTTSDSTSLPNLSSSNLHADGDFPISLGKSQWAQGAEDSVSATVEYVSNNILPDDGIEDEPPPSRNQQLLRDEMGHLGNQTDHEASSPSTDAHGCELVV